MKSTGAWIFHSKLSLRKCGSKPCTKTLISRIDLLLITWPVVPQSIRARFYQNSFKFLRDNSAMRNGPRVAESSRHQIEIGDAQNIWKLPALVKGVLFCLGNTKITSTSCFWKWWWWRRIFWTVLRALPWGKHNFKSFFFACVRFYSQFYVPMKSAWQQGIALFLFSKSTVPRLNISYFSLSLCDSSKLYDGGGKRG